jgi:Cof subfamily protein (haloacid dehalogenase superfamily)
MIRLLAIDIDGTLLDGRGRLPDAHRDALVEAVERGIEIVLVTGRSFHFTRGVVDRLPVPLTLIVNNGAVVKRKSGETEWRRVLDREAARAILAGTRHLEDSVALVFDRPGERQIVFERMDWTHPNRRGYYEKNKAYIFAAPPPLSDVLTDDPIQVMFNGSVQPMRELVAALRAMPIADRFSVASTEYEARDFSLVDVNGAGCSKGTTLARWATARGFTTAEVMAVGDNLNDIEMLDFAGVPVVMGNATDAIKSRGYHLTGTNDDGGLAAAIRLHALGPCVEDKGERAEQKREKGRGGPR